jgi:hypothetical protein
MVSTYKLNTDELTSDFILTMQKSYPKKNVKILVRETDDETEYLLGTPANRSHLHVYVDCTGYINLGFQITTVMISANCYGVHFVYL